ncbi:MAG: GNAT family N-acetyltransferase [Gammaproteobacteria bacterium]
MNQVSSTIQPAKTADATLENPAWKIRVVNSVEGFSGLRNSWDRLLHQSGHATVFNSWEWQYHWWKHYGNSHQLRILVVESDTEVVGIAPFYMRRFRPLGLFSISILQLIGTGGDTSPDYLDLLCSAEHEVPMARRLSAYILEDWPEWDVAHWSDMPEASLLYAEFSKQAQVNFSLELGISSHISQIELPDNWDRFIESATTKKRNKIRNRWCRMETEVKGSFFVWQDGDTLDRALHTLVELHHKRWDGRVNQCAFSSNAYIAFHRDIMHSFHARNWLRLFCLAVGDQIIAMDYCYQFNGTVMQFQRGFDSEYGDYSPGFVLMCHSFQEAIKEGNSLFDFLKGDYAHKKEFETCSTTTRYLNCYRRNGPAESYRFLEQVRKGLRSLLK